MQKTIIGMIFHGEYPTHPRIENQALHLISEGAEIHLFCVTYQKKKAGMVVHKGINVHRTYLPNWMYKLSALAYTFPLYHRLMSSHLKQFIQNSKAQTLHLHNMNLAQPVFDINQSAKLPIVLDLHENVPEIMKLYPHLQKGLGKFLINPVVWKKKEQEFIKRSAAIIVVTNEAKEEVLSRVEIDDSKILVLPNFTDDSFIKPEYDKSLAARFKSKFNMLYIGDTGVRRGLESVMKAIPLLINDISNLNLIIVGSSSNDENLRVLMQKEGVENFVSVEGWQSENLLADYVNVAHVGLCPILRNLHHDTTYANKLFQYARLGKPILASNSTAQKNLIESESWGLIHEANDPEDFAKQLKKLYLDETLRTQLGQNAAKSIRKKFNYSSSEFGIEFYQELNLR
ncbi:Glycosyltransferase involved in cell wall bisynthesis [Reichenbachiella faecimaris]|uniref:Glycosyltransferase involved in cell wall bisynthesis n=1 Tax=Reichenbachiella faecimaris TaxID=692418 RepID=A0A1W2G6U2_REIFA|nr:glycosyltransferase [Reichenbachiella faecimaris]SMD32389.1 Glycosyltransferase involved in cell wall bisynthesis [Reichenbachiella faecimaris]